MARPLASRPSPAHPGSPRSPQHLGRATPTAQRTCGLTQRRQHSAEDSADTYRRVELITGRRRRRDWTLEEKAEILAASLEPGRTVSEVAAQYQVSRGLLWTWRRNAREASADAGGPAFVPLRLAAEPPDASSTEAAPEPVSGGPAAARAGLPSGSLEIAVGRARVRVQGVVDPEALRQVLALVATAR
jgi:transposase